MNKRQKKDADFIFLILAALFLAALVCTNMIASKFVTVDLGFYVFTISAGILPYPATFLITDLLSEIYGRERTQKVVFAGFFASVFVLGILWLGNQFEAIPDSPISTETYSNVFGLAPRVIFSSMLAYLVAQFADVRLFHFWKKLTNGKHLWLRNNASTVVSQLLDSTLVVVVLFYDSMTVSQMGGLIFHSWLFKTMVALLDTPLVYAGVYGLRKRFNLKQGKEVAYY